MQAAAVVQSPWGLSPLLLPHRHHVIVNVKYYQSVINRLILYLSLHQILYLHQYLHQFLYPHRLRPHVHHHQLRNHSNLISLWLSGRTT